MSKSAGELETEQRSTLIALEEIRTELSQLPEHELLHQNVVPLTALVTVRGVYRELKGLRAEMLRLPDFEIANLDRLELYARAFVGAQARYDALRESNREPEALKAEAEALRAQLYDDVKTLVRRKIVAPQRIEKLSRRRGYEHVASDLLLLVTVFRCHLNSIAGKCATTEQELVRAEALAHGITAVVSRRREPLEAVRDALEVRKRAFTVFMRAYASLAVLLEDLAKPPIEKVGALNIDAFLPKSERKALAAALNTLLASPTFASWREGATLDIKAWMTPKNGRTPAVILSVAHRR